MDARPVPVTPLGADSYVLSAGDTRIPLNELELRALAVEISEAVREYVDVLRPEPEPERWRSNYFHGVDADDLDRITDPNGLTIDAALYEHLMTDTGNAR